MTKVTPVRGIDKRLLKRVAKKTGMKQGELINTLLRERDEKD